MLVISVLKGLKFPTIAGRICCTYMTPVDKPVFSLALTSLQEMSSQLMLYSYIEMSACPEVSVFCGAVAFRLGMEVLASIVRGFKFTNKNDLTSRDYVSQRYQEDDRASVKWTDRIFVLDSVRDLQFYGVYSHDINRTIRNYYHPSTIVASAVNCYMALNFFRGAHQLAIIPQYSQFCDNTAYLTSLALHDPKFLTPILIMGVSFACLKGSRHPFLININHPGNFFHCFNIAFMAGLLFVPLPGIYHFAYLGMAVSHLLIRTTKYTIQDIMQGFRKLLK